MTKRPTRAKPKPLPPIRIGVGGWTFEPWRDSFYPAGLAHRRELEFASRALTSIEINGTYYGSQKPESFAKWHAETPDDFVFAVKGPRFATNRRVLAEAGPSIDRFLASGVLELKAKLGPINWQFLPTKQFDPADFAAFLALLPAEKDARPLRHVVEPRHPSFRCAEFVALLRQHQVATVTAGDSDFPQIADTTAPFVYLRLMGSQPDGYPDAALAAWIARARLWQSGGAPADLPLLAPPAPMPAGREVFLYVISGHKPRNPAAAQSMLRLLA